MSPWPSDGVPEFQPKPQYLTETVSNIRRTEPFLRYSTPQDASLSGVCFTIQFSLELLSSPRCQRLHQARSAPGPNANAAHPGAYLPTYTERHTEHYFHCITARHSISAGLNGFHGYSPLGMSSRVDDEYEGRWCVGKHGTPSSFT